MVPGIRAGFAVSVLGAFALLALRLPAGAQPPSKEDARKVLGPRGGTILVYEIGRKKRERAPADAEKLLAEVLKRRLDPNKLYDIAIRPVEKDRLEIILRAKDPQSEAKGPFAEEVKRIKRLVSQVGSLEFRILANSYDDKRAIEEARTLINSGTPEVNKALEQAQLDGLPPPGPRTAGLAGEPKVFEIVLAKGTRSRVAYSWVELGPHELQLLGLDNAVKDDPRRNVIWKAAAKFRGKAGFLSPPAGASWKLMEGALFYSRECKARDLPAEERRQKQYEYFVLTREPEVIDGKQTPRIDGSYLTSALSARAEGRPVVMFALNAVGGDLIRELTRKNVPSGSAEEGSQVKRHLAILLDGLVVAAPTLNSEIGQHALISGNFTKQEVDAIVNVLRAGSLPVSLRPRPVVEITIGPQTK